MTGVGESLCALACRSQTAPSHSQYNPLHVRGHVFNQACITAISTPVPLLDISILIIPSPQIKVVRCIPWERKEHTHLILMITDEYFMCTSFASYFNLDKLNFTYQLHQVHKPLRRQRGNKETRLENIVWRMRTKSTHASLVRRRKLERTYCIDKKNFSLHQLYIPHWHKGKGSFQD